MPAKKGELDFLDRFAGQLENSLHRPNINRYVPMEHQKLFHMAQTRHRVTSGGNRSGKTWSGIADDCWILQRKHPWRNHLYPPAGQPVRMRFIGVDFDRGIDQTAIPIFSQMLPPSMLVNGSWEDSYNKSNRILNLADKSSVSFMSYEQDPNKFQMVSLHHIHFDEEPPEAIFKESELRLLDTNGTWTLTETPVEQMEWIENELIDKSLPPVGNGERPNVTTIFLDTRLNTHLPPDALADLMRDLSAEDAKIRLEGGYLDSNKVFPGFKRAHPNTLTDEAFRAEIPGHLWRVFEGMDWGTVNPAAWVWVAVNELGHIYTFRAMYGKGATVSDWIPRVHAMRRQVAEVFGVTVERLLSEMVQGTVGDPSIGDRGNASAQTGLTIQQAFAIGGVHIGTQGIRAQRSGNQNVGLDKMRTYLKPRPDGSGLPWWRIVDWDGAEHWESTKPLIDEIFGARKPKQTLKAKGEKNSSEEIRDKDNHAIDASKYVFVTTHELRPAVVAVEQIRVPDEVVSLMQPTSPPPITHDDVFNAMVAANDPNSWSSSIGSSYSAMEE